jgi:hypothetical protein
MIMIEMLNKNIYSKFFWGKKPAESINLLSLKFWYSKLCTWQVLGSELRAEEDLTKSCLCTLLSCVSCVIDWWNFLWWSNSLWAAVLTRVYDHVWLMKLSLIVQQFVSCCSHKGIWPTMCDWWSFLWLSNRLWAAVLTRVWLCVIDEAVFDCPTDCSCCSHKGMTMCDWWSFLWLSNRLWAAVLTRVWPCVIDEAFFDCPTDCELLLLLSQGCSQPVLARIPPF